MNPIVSFSQWQYLRRQVFKLLSFFVMLGVLILIVVSGLTTGRDLDRLGTSTREGLIQASSHYSQHPAIAVEEGRYQDNNKAGSHSQYSNPDPHSSIQHSGPVTVI